TSELGTTECDDGVDNASDTDTLADMNDPGCTGPDDASELGTVECDDGVDNASDTDTAVDMNDPGCTGPDDTSELGTTECDDGVDNDGWGDVDLNDPGCTGPADDEYGTEVCDDGVDNDGDTFIDQADSGCWAYNDAAETAIWFVATTGDDSTGRSWAEAWQVIQTAATTAQAGDQVWVKQGSYYRPSAARVSVLIMKNGVEFYGGFQGTESALLDRGDPAAYPTILDGEQQSYHVVVGASNARLDGFSITNGLADGTGGDNDGGGMHNSSKTNLVIANCVFFNNSTVGSLSFGGGMANISCSPTIDNCTFSGNSAYSGGGIYNSSSNPSITNCRFIGNFWEHVGGGIYNYSSSSPTVSNCIFSGNLGSESGNSSAAGINNYLDSHALITNCLFVGNQAFQAGVLDNYNNCSAAVTNCTFNRNYQTYGPNQIIYNFDSSLVMTNSVVWGNRADTDILTIGVFGTSTADVSYSDVEGGYAGTGNLDSNPLFAGNPAFSGTWTAAPVYSSTFGQTTLTDSAATWTPGALAGMFLNPDIAQHRLFLVAANDATTVTVWSDVTGLAASGDSYRILDFYLSQTAAGQGADSPCVDAGGDLASDLGLDAYTTRTDGVLDSGTVDMGYHYQP
ncbi:MAG: hypothetical protein A2V67_20785, partial [Deltaproteobacteria bacterium RBG_13_61_14]